MKKIPHWILYALLAVLYLLHNDFWLRDSPGLFWGLPVGLTYHIGFCLLTVAVMFLLVKFAWPERLTSDYTEVK